MPQCVCVFVCLCMCLLLQFVTSVVPVSACLRSLRCSDHINPNVHSRVGLRQSVTKLRCGRNMTCQGLVVYVYHSDHSGYFPSVRSISPFWGSSNRVALSSFPQNWREFLQEEHSSFQVKCPLCSELHCFTYSCCISVSAIPKRTLTMPRFPTESMSWAKIKT